MSETTTAGGGGGCLHCSLLTSSVSSSDSEAETAGQLDLFPVTAFLLPGLYLTVLSVRWWTVSVSGWLQEARHHRYSLAGLPPPPPPAASLTSRAWPWEGAVKIVLALLASSLTGCLPSSVPQSHWIIINIYIFFTLSGTVDLLVFYCGYSLLPEGLQSFILAATFGVETLSYHALISPATSLQLLLLLLLTSACSLTAALETVVDNRLIKFCRCFFTSLQAAWLLQLTRLSTSSPSPTWVAVIFAWQAAGLFTISVLVLMMAQLCCKPSQRPDTRLRSV